MLRAGSKLILVAFAATLLTFCGGDDDSSSPTTKEVDQYISSITASDGSVATRRTGAPPAPNGGPDLTATSSGAVSSGGTDSVRLRAASAFQKVYAGIEGTEGYYELPLNAPTVDITVTTRLASSIPSNNYLASYRAASPSGLVGNPSTVNNTVQTPTPPPSGSTNVTGTWSVGGQPQWILSQSGSTVTGSQIFPAFPSDPSYTISFVGTINGTVSGSTFTATENFTFSETAPGAGLLLSCTQQSTINATISGNTMTGTYTSGTLTCVTNLVGFPSTFAGSSGPFTATRQ